MASGPGGISEREYLREIWGDEMVNDDAFASQPLLRDFVSLVRRHGDAISLVLRAGDTFTPILFENENGIALANDWANGFMRGMKLRQAHWAPLFDDEENAGMIVPIFALAHENDPDPEMRPYPEPITPEQREKLIVGAAAGVMMIYKYFERARAAATHELDDATYHRGGPKVGRNEPCPCGSGKKFKHCCGKITLH